MIRSTPSWTYRTRRPIRWGYGRVWLLPDRVLGTWFLLDRTDGRELLRRRWTLGPDFIEDVAGGVAVAGRLEGRGIWGVDAATLKPLWTSHAPGLRGRLLRLLDVLPNLDSGLHDSPFRILDGEVHTWRGRILDLRTGRDLRRRDPPRIEEKQTPAEAFFDARPFLLSGGRRLRQGRPEAPLPEGRYQSGKNWSVFCEGSDGKPEWVWDLTDPEEWTAGTFFASRWAEPFLHVVVSKGERGAPSDYATVDATPRRHWIRTLDTRTGKIRQEVAVGEAPLLHVEVESIDPQGILMSAREPANRENLLLHFAREGG